MARRIPTWLSCEKTASTAIRLPRCGARSSQKSGRSAGMAAISRPDSDLFISRERRENLGDAGRRTELAEIANLLLAF